MQLAFGRLAHGRIKESEAHSPSGISLEVNQVLFSKKTDQSLSRSLILVVNERGP